MIIDEAKLKLYYDWAREQKRKLTGAFSDDNGELKQELIIPYLHLTHIGGSTVPAIMGVSKWETAAQVYDKMTGAIDTSVVPDNFVFERGHACEPFIREQAGKLLKLEPEVGNVLYDPDRPYSMTQIDSYMGAGHIPCEIKCVSFNNATSDGKEWGNGCVINDNGEIIKEDDLVPVAYYIQCQKQMYMTKWKYMFLAAWLTFENRIRIYVINRDDDVIKQIIDAEDNFLFNNVIAGVRPAEVEIKEDVDVVKGKAMTTTARLDELLAKYHELEQEVSPKKKELDVIKDQISELMADANVLVDENGNKLVTKSTVASSRFNTTKFKNDNAELYAQYLTTSNSVRLTIKK